MKTLRIYWLQDIHLSEEWLSSIDFDKAKDRVLLTEVLERYTYLKYHKQKLIFHIASLRHFAASLRSNGYQVDYVSCDSFRDVIPSYIQQLEAFKIDLHTSNWYVVLPTDWYWRKILVETMDAHLIRWERVEDDFLYLTPRMQWPHFLPESKKWKMEPVYQKLRKKYRILMDGERPAGGKWNFDEQNRKPANPKKIFVEPLQLQHDEITISVIQYVEKHFADHPGSIVSFHWPVTKQQAEAMLTHFIDYRLADFGEQQDAMLVDHPFMSHSLLSVAINVGLLNPLTVIQQAEIAYLSNLVSLAAAEGFIRQILGWREYIRGVYICSEESYRDANVLNAQRELPHFYWDGQTSMNCLRSVIEEVLENGYSHHIQRLMVLCNFANLAGVVPQAVRDWFNQMYVDSQDWVVSPNVIGMGLFADGGKMSTKPYVSSAQYIKKMSNYCNRCEFDPNERIGEKACPFNALYWTFLSTHENLLQKNHRMSMMIASLKKWTERDKSDCQKQAQNLLKRLEKHQI